LHSFDINKDIKYELFKRSRKGISKIMEIYTHVSIKNLQNIISPADFIFPDKEKINE